MLYLMNMLGWFGGLGRQGGGLGSPACRVSDYRVMGEAKKPFQSSVRVCVISNSPPSILIANGSADLIFVEDTITKNTPEL